MTAMEHLLLVPVEHDCRCSNIMEIDRPPPSAKTQEFNTGPRMCYSHLLLPLHGIQSDQSTLPSAATHESVPEVCTLLGKADRHHHAVSFKGVLD